MHEGRKWGAVFAGSVAAVSAGAMMRSATRGQRLSQGGGLLAILALILIVATVAVVVLVTPWSSVWARWRTFTPVLLIVAAAAMLCTSPALEYSSPGERARAAHCPE